MGRISRGMLLAGVSAFALMIATPSAHAGDILRGNTTASPTANVTAAQAAAMQQAQQAAGAGAKLAVARGGEPAVDASRPDRRPRRRQCRRQHRAQRPHRRRPDAGFRIAIRHQPAAVLAERQFAVAVHQRRPDHRRHQANATQAILNWQTFNVGKNTTVVFDQQGNSNWIALNRVLDPTGNPSLILGSIKADGQVYIINQNGIIFGGSSQINVGSLVASALPINDALVQAGTLFSNLDAQFTFSAYSQPGGPNGPTNPFTAPAATAASQNSAVIVQAGAQISTPLSSTNNGGRVILIGPEVTNAGSISTPDGQTILAAGQQVALLPHDTNDPSLRGFDVYIGSILAPAIGSNTVAGSVTTGTAINTGIIEADRGDIYMAGPIINQNGAMIATTSVSLNGRIDIDASYNAATLPSAIFLRSSTGTASLGAGSLTEILPEWSSTDTVVGTSLALPSQVNINGNIIYIDGQILAPSGNVTVRAGQWDILNEFEFASGQIYVDAAASIDVSRLDGRAGLGIAEHHCRRARERTARRLAVAARDVPARRNHLCRYQPDRYQPRWIDLDWHAHSPMSLAMLD